LELDNFRDKMYCRECLERVNISTNKAIVEADSKGYFWIYCRKCRNLISEANDVDYLNQRHDEGDLP